MCLKYIFFVLDVLTISSRLLTVFPSMGTWANTSSCIIIVIWNASRTVRTNTKFTMLVLNGKSYKTVKK